MQQINSHVAAGSPIRIGWDSAATLLRTWATLWSERRALDRLDDRMLRDIGLSEGVAHSEAARPMWDVPAHRHPSAV